MHTHYFMNNGVGICTQIRRCEHAPCASPRGKAMLALNALQASDSLRSSRKYGYFGHRTCAKRLVARRGIKWIENFETQLEIPEDRKKALEELLENETFCLQVAKETNMEGPEGLEYSKMLFQPVPWSPATTKGMPAELEKYHSDPNYCTVNVPPNFLFKAQIFKPSRLCALYRKKGAGG